MNIDDFTEAKLQQWLGESNTDKIKPYPKIHRTSMKTGNLSPADRKCIFIRALDTLSFHVYQKPIKC